MILLFLYGPPAVGKLTTLIEVIKSPGNEKWNFKLFHNQMVVDIISSIMPYGSPESFKLAGTYYYELI